MRRTHVDRARRKQGDAALSRRDFFGIAALGAAGLLTDCDGAKPGGDAADADAGTAPGPLPGPTQPPDALAAPDAPDAIVESTDFPLGVASGDVEESRAIVWARCFGVASLRARVWLMDGATYATRIVDEIVLPDEAGYVHLEVAGLTGGARYRYAFFEEQGEALIARSPIGRFRAALAAGVQEPLTFGACSCTSRPNPAPIARAAERDDLDLFLLLGDTSYNDGKLTLDEFRAEWHKTLSDPEYRALRAATSVIATWDDHEVQNDFNPETIDPARLAGARQALFDSLPLRRNPASPDRVWKQLRWGSTADFFVLDGRSERLPSTRLSGLVAGDQIYLSRTQMEWFKQALVDSTATFKIIVNSVPISDFGFSAFNIDGWQAYGKQRTEILSFIDEHAIQGVLWVAGDHHFASAGRVADSGPGANALEVLAGPGSQNGNPVAHLLLPPRWDFSSSVNNYLAVHLQPATREARLVWHDGGGGVLFDKTYAV